MYLVPAEGLLVPDMVMLDHLPPNGRKVEPSEFWTRRLMDGDVSDSPEAITAALERATAERDTARATRDTARATAGALKADTDVATRAGAEEALAVAENALAAAEAIVADVAPHAPKPIHTPRRAAAPTQE